jgi:hypothetical protein
MAPTTRQTTAARKRTAPKPAPTTADGTDFEPIRIVANEDAPQERVPLFYIGDTEYTAPKEISRGPILKYLRLAGEIGPEPAAPQLLIRVLGEESYMALEESDALTEEQFDAIVNEIIKRGMGPGEGKAKRG